MKKILFSIIVLMAMASCHSSQYDYQDYDYQSVYFPFQYPVRTLSLGNDRLDNSLDRAHQFNIGVSLGGVYLENDVDRTVHFTVDDTMVDNNLYTQSGLKIKAMPKEYYTLNPSTSVVIRKGELNGLIRVQLSDAFFADPDAVNGNLVIPLKILSAEKVDTILVGKPVVDNPNVHSASDWEKAPKNYTLFGVKYVNPYHGKWLRRGVLNVYDGTDNLIEQKTYHATDLELNEIVSLATVTLDQADGKWQGGADSYNIRLKVSKDGQIAISSTSGLTLSGKGSYAEGAESWGGTVDNPIARDVLYLDYNYTRANGNRCQVRDTLVFRDRAIVFEDRTPVLQ